MLELNFGLTGTVSCGCTLAEDGRRRAFELALRTLARAFELAVARRSEGDIEGRPVAGAELDLRPVGVADTSAARPRAKRAKVGVAVTSLVRAFFAEDFGADADTPRFLSSLCLPFLADELRRGVLLAPRFCWTPSFELRVRLDTGASANDSRSEGGLALRLATVPCAIFVSSASFALKSARARIFSVSFDGALPP